MNLIQINKAIDEKISLATPCQSSNNERLSQNHKAVTPSGYYWLFLCPSHGISLPYIQFAPMGKLPLMVWLILQNKPFGEYVERYLCEPRVRPYRPILGLSTQNHKGAFPC